MHGREASAHIIEAWLKTRAFPDRMLAAVDVDRAFVTQVVFGVVRRYRALDWIARRMVSRKPETALRAILLVALYQILDMDTVPDHAVVHTAVDLARAREGEKGAAFVNAVLRRALRDKDVLRDSLAKQKLGIRLSHPDNLLKRWMRQLDRDAVAELCRWNNEEPPTVLAVCLARVSVQDLRERLAATGIVSKPHPFCPDQYLVLPRGVAVPDVPGYKEGHFFVQDPSCSEAIRLLDPRPGERILDACAAPGGKLMLAADRMRGEGQLVAADRHADRMGRLRENVARVGWKNIRVAQADARNFKDLHAALNREPADAVLLDVPCTNTGVLRRRPDARWRFTEERLTTQAETQKEILHAAARCLKPGGRMVYSTCSLEPEEDEQLVAGWLASAPEFRLVDEVKRIPPADDIDGAYAALLVRRPA